MCQAPFLISKSRNELCTSLLMPSLDICVCSSSVWLALQKDYIALCRWHITYKRFFLQSPKFSDLFLIYLKHTKVLLFFYYNNVFHAHAGKSPFYYQKMSIENDSELRLRGSLPAECMVMLDTWMSSKHRYCENNDCPHFCLQDFSNSERAGCSLQVCWFVLSLYVFRYPWSWWTNK